MVLAIGLMAGVMASPAEAAKAKKPPPEPAELVEAFLANLEKATAAYETAAGKLDIDAEKRLERAVDRISLREVLKVDQVVSRGADRALQTFKKLAEREQGRLLKALDKITDNPEHALTVRMETAEALARVQSAHNELRAETAERVNSAIDAIQEALLEADAARL
jgi:hypothetical protein